MSHRVAERPSILTEPRRKDEEVESETKFFGVSYRGLEKRLSVLGTTEIFRGFIRTRSYNVGLPSGVSTSVRETYDENGTVRFFGRIKRNPVGEEPTDILKNKWEQEPEFDTRTEAEEWLIAMRKERGIPIRGSGLKLDYEFGKRRISHVFNGTPLAVLFPGMQLDFDKVIEVNGKSINSRRWLEIQNTLDRSAQEKRTLILNCAAHLKITLERPELARVSTKTVLKEEGLL